MKSDSGKLYSWIVEGNNRRHAFDQLQQGDKPDALIILTGRLSTAQRHAWTQAAQEHGGFDDQMARSVLGTF
jgi:hypothetical protein